MEWWQQKEIVVSFFGLLSAVLVAIITGLFSKYRFLKASSMQGDRKIKFQRAALDFGAPIHDWAETHSEIKYLLENTEIDRVTIFKAWNGECKPRWTTSVFQMRLGSQESIQYGNFELIYSKVADIKDSAIKKAYEAEGVRASIWCRIMSETLKGSKSTVHTYCSFSSHVVDELDETTITKCRILAGRLKGVPNSFSG